jgi:hypothetical protein
MRPDGTSRPRFSLPAPVCDGGPAEHAVAPLSRPVRLPPEASQGPTPASPAPARRPAPRPEPLRPHPEESTFTP